MPCDNPTGGSDPVVPPTTADDLRSQRVVLMHVLDVDPARLIVPELVREISVGTPDFAEGDNLERAVRDLTGIGLLNCPGGLVVPSRAALRFDELLGG